MSDVREGIRPKSSSVERVTIKVTYHYRSGKKGTRTIQLPPTARKIVAEVQVDYKFGYSFEIPVQAVEAGLAEWFNRTEGELSSFVGAGG